LQQIIFFEKIKKKNLKNTAKMLFFLENFYIIFSFIFLFTNCS